MIKEEDQQSVEESEDESSEYEEEMGRNPNNP